VDNVLEELSTKSSEEYLSWAKFLKFSFA